MTAALSRLSRRTLLRSAAAAALLATTTAPLASLAAPAPTLTAQPLFWHDGPLHSMFARGHLDPVVFLEAARRDADEFLVDHTTEKGFEDWGNEKDVLTEWDAADVRHEHQRWVVYDTESYDHFTQRMEGIAVILPAGPDGYPLDTDRDDASLVKCGPEDEGAFPVTILWSGLDP